MNAVVEGVDDGGRGLGDRSTVELSEKGEISDDSALVSAVSSVSPGWVEEIASDDTDEVAGDGEAEEVGSAMEVVEGTGAVGEGITALVTEISPEERR